MPLGKSDIPHDTREKIVEVVGDASSQNAYRFQLGYLCLFLLQPVRFGNVAVDDLTQALSKAVSLPPDDPKVFHAAAAAAGSFGKALSLIEESLDVFAGQAELLWQLCVQEASLHSITGVLESITQEHIGGGYDYTAGEKLLTSFLHLIRATFFHGMSGTQKYINVLVSQPTAVPVPVETAQQLSTTCEQAIAAVRARGNVLLVLSTFFMSIMEIMHGQK